MQITNLHPDLLNKSLQGTGEPPKAQVFLKDCSDNSEAVVALELIVLTR